MSGDTSIRVMNSKSENSKRFKEDLTFFDLTNIIVGSIVGADIYIAPDSWNDRTFFNTHLGGCRYICYNNSTGFCLL
jgi:hypothetical protein